MRDSKWPWFIWVGIVVPLLAAAAGCKTEAQKMEDEANERLPSLVGVTVSPIQAVFDQKTFSTTYRVEVTGQFENSFLRSEWSGPDCGNWSVVHGENGESPVVSNLYEFKWYHPHPPCPETTDHTHVDVKLVLTQWGYEEVDGKFVYRGDNGAKIVCTYHGSETGTGAKPIWQ